MIEKPVLNKYIFITYFMRYQTHMRSWDITTAVEDIFKNPFEKLMKRNKKKRYANNNTTMLWRNLKNRFVIE